MWKWLEKSKGKNRGCDRDDFSECTPPTNWFDELTPIGGRHPIKFPFAINYEVILAPRQRALYFASSRCTEWRANMTKKEIREKKNTEYRSTGFFNLYKDLPSPVIPVLPYANSNTYTSSCKQNARTFSSYRAAQKWPTEYIRSRIRRFGQSRRMKNAPNLVNPITIILIILMVFFLFFNDKYNNFTMKHLESTTS